MEELLDLIEKLLTMFEFKSSAALKFRQDKNRNLLDLINSKLEIKIQDKKENFITKLFGKRQDKNKKKFNQFYWNQLKKIILLTGLSEDKERYNLRIVNKLKEINKHGDYKGL